MPSPLAHTLAGSILYLGTTELKDFKTQELVLYIVAANILDLDFFTIESGTIVWSPLFHHGPGHSIFTGVSLFFMTKVMLGKRVKIRIGLLIAILSHILLDYFTFDQVHSINGYGVMLFWPFSYAFYISPVIIFYGPDTINLLNPDNFKVIVYDLYLLLPLIFIFSARWNLKRKRDP